MAALVFPTALQAAAQTPLNTFSPTSAPLVNTSNTNTYTYDTGLGVWTASGAGGGSSVTAATLAEAAAGTLNTVFSSPQTAVPKDASGMAGAALIPGGNNAARPTSPVTGMVRYNNQGGTPATTAMEYWNGASWTQWGVGGGGSLTYLPSQTASGSSFDFTGIPATAKRVYIIVQNVITTGGYTGGAIQLGTSGGVDTTANYSANNTSMTSTSSTVSVQAATNRLNIWATNGYDVVSTGTLTSVGSDTWVWSAVSQDFISTRTWLQGGSKVLTGALDRIRFTSQGGADTFSGGTITVIYEL